MSPASIVPQHLQIVNDMSMSGLLQVFLAVSQIAGEAQEAQTHISFNVLQNIGMVCPTDYPLSLL